MIPLHRQRRGLRFRLHPRCLSDAIIHLPVGARVRRRGQNVPDTDAGSSLRPMGTCRPAEGVRSPVSAPGQAQTPLELEVGLGEVLEMPLVTTRSRNSSVASNGAPTVPRAWRYPWIPGWPTPNNAAAGPSRQRMG